MNVSEKENLELLKLSEITVAIAKLKFSGVDFDAMFSVEDQTTSKLQMERQTKKIRGLFQTPSLLRNAFSTPEKTKQAYKDMFIDGIDMPFVRAYCTKKDLESHDDERALLSFAFPRFIKEQSQDCDNSKHSFENGLDCWYCGLKKPSLKEPEDERPIEQGPECEPGDNHDFGGETVCMLCGISYAELYCDAYNGEDR